MKKIVFVCHGNICRSPLAEYLFKHIVIQNGKDKEIEIISRATSLEEIGNDLYPPIKRVLQKHSIPFSRHYATRLVPSDYDKYDLFVGMDDANVRNMHRIFGGDPDGKICKLMDFTQRGGNVRQQRADACIAFIQSGQAVFRQVAKGEHFVRPAPIFNVQQ